jgi:small redox-active disulfide protein 2
MKVEILGMGCAKCKKLHESTLIAVKELNVNADVVKIEDLNKIIEYSVLSTPALAVDGVVKSSGKLLSVSEIKNIISKL